VALSPEEASMTIDEIVRETISGIKQDNSDAKVVEQTKQNVSGLDGRKVIFSDKVDGVPIKGAQVYVINNGNYFVISLAGSAGIYPSYATTFDNMIKSFVIK
jgi:Zn-dependent metalloprotease